MAKKQKKSDGTCRTPLEHRPIEVIGGWNHPVTPVTIQDRKGEDL